MYLNVTPRPHIIKGFIQISADVIFANFGPPLQVADTLARPPSHLTVSLPKMFRSAPLEKASERKASETPLKENLEAKQRNRR